MLCVRKCDDDVLATPITFILGLQKSGTTPLHRLLQQLPGVVNPVVGEGAAFWGDSPPFSPSLAPCGLRYGDSFGARGHALDAKDFSVDDKALLTARSRHFATGDHWVMKNPYNSVRAHWLKRMFPDARIVACIRHPAANIFSLLKKFVAHEGRGLAPEEGWWGVKPDGWREMLRTDKVEQLAMQWRAVNQALLSAHKEINCWIDYAEFCANPRGAIAAIFENNPPDLTNVPVTLRSSNGEYLTGGPARSRNRAHVDTDSEAWLDPLSSSQFKTIEQLTASTWNALTHART